MQAWIKPLLKPKKGNILIPLLISLSIAIVIGSYVLVTVRWFATATMYSELDILKATVHYERLAAMASGTIRTIICNTQNNTYTHDGTVYTLSPTVQYGYLDHVKGPPSTPRTLITTPCTFNNNEITCYPNGITSSGTIYLCDKNKSEQGALTLGVIPVPFMRTYRYYHSHWYSRETP